MAKQSTIETPKSLVADCRLEFPYNEPDSSLVNITKFPLRCPTCGNPKMEVSISQFEMTDNRLDVAVFCDYCKLTVRNTTPPLSQWEVEYYPESREPFYHPDTLLPDGKLLREVLRQQRH